MSEQNQNPFFETTVEVRTPIEYGIALAAYVMAGANVWPWHKGYKERDSEECAHHLYGWEPAGFMKQVGGFEGLPGTYKSPIELLKAVKAYKEGQKVEVAVTVSSRDAERPTKVGQRVSPVSYAYELRSGAEAYSFAIVVSMEPFVLVSERGDMRWQASVKPEFFHVIGEATSHELEIAMARLEL